MLDTTSLNAESSGWNVDLFTLFPEMFPGPLGLSLAGRALEEGRWSLNVHDLRDFGLGKHRALDDTPYGGGAGMVLRADVLERAVASLENGLDGRRLIVPTPRGVPVRQKTVEQWANEPRGPVIFCGRFEGMDQRFLEHFNATEICWGDCVLSGGDIPAMALIDSCVRLLPGVMGSNMSGVEESFEDDLLEYPHYTRPAVWQDRAVPEVLLSGNHRAIEEWRLNERQSVTRERRPDLWARFKDNAEH